MTPKSVVIFSMAGTAAVVVGSDAARGIAPKPREILGLFFAFLGLSAVADFAPQLAEPAALLVLTSSTLLKGPIIFNAVANLNPTTPSERKQTDVSKAQAAGNAAFGGAGARIAPVGYPFSQRVATGGGPGQGTHRSGNWESSNAVDLMSACHTPVLAVADGTIGVQIGPLANASGECRFDGHRLHLVTRDNEWYYAHLLSISVIPGQRVKRGQVLGSSGSACSVCHLHLASKYGNPVTLIGV